jgi:hypothetical protein
MHALRMRRCDQDEIDKARAELPDLIRVPQLSRFWLLTALTTKNDHDRFILSTSHLRPNLIGLVSLLLETATDSSSSSSGVSRLDPEQLQRLLPACPASWLKGPRLIQPAKPLVVSRTLDVAFLQNQAKDVHSERLGGSGKTVTCTISPQRGALLGGCRWSPGFTFTKGHRGVTIGLSVCLSEESAIVDDRDTTVFYQFDCEVSCFGITRKASSGLTNSSRRGVVWEDFFGVGPMANGWDEAAWAAKGLPTEGELVVQMTVSNVGHAPQLSTATAAAGMEASTAAPVPVDAAAAAKEEDRSADAGLTAAAADTAAGRDQ